MKRYIKSFTTDELKSALGDNYPKGGYLYIFKHGIGPGTIPDDVKVVKVKDLPNYYTAVWLDRFLTTPELKQYDIPDETRINELLGRIGYCQKNGDVVPCDDVQACGDIKASTMPKPTIDDVLKLIADKKIIFKNDVAYWSRGKGVLPKEYRDCIAQTEYAHWINEWSCEQAEKFGDRAYYDYDGEVEVDSCSTVTASTDDSSIVNKIYSVMMDYEYGYDPDMADINAMLQELTSKGVHVDTSDAFKKAWVSAHNKAERKTWGGSGDSYHYDSLTPSELEAIENYDTEYWEYVKDHPFNLKPASATDITSSICTPKYMADMISASSSDSAYDENDEPYRYYVAGYYSVDSNGHPYGLAESLYTNDFDEALETAHTYCGNGDYVEFTNQITGMSLDYDPDDWNEAIEYGEFPTSVYDLL